MSSSGAPSSTSAAATTATTQTVSNSVITQTIGVTGAGESGYGSIPMLTGGPPSSFPTTVSGFGRIDPATMMNPLYSSLSSAPILSTMNPMSNLPFTGNLDQTCNVKLDRSNYLLWKPTVLPIIKGHRLEGHVLGDDMQNMLSSCPFFVSPSPYQRPQTVEEWSTDQLLVGWLLSSMTEQALLEVVGCNSAREILTTLETLFNSLVESRMLEYKSALTRATKGTKSMADNLTAAGYPISKSELILATLGSLDKEYEVVIFNLTAMVGKGSVPSPYT